MNTSVRNRLAFFPVLLLLLVLALPGRAAALTEAEVSNHLMCYACPEDQLSVCNCGGAQEMKDTIHRMIGEGKSKQEILDYFVARYGEAIISTPPQKGFALTAYVAPYVGLCAGAIVALFLVGRWARRSGKVNESETAAADDSPAIVDAAARERVAQELARLEKEE
ncbi:Cytochrome c-type biogenesis protein CcmH precursor [Desulfuromonas sp. DDH964]|uniref:cytochrome c-type biogenesis protein n=1 Tax=Desulfuromonas sp. DDH964 TaxID=1823759 RepID=UPI00078BF9FB|nr:cytochrome c-type biogenesis protein CcmH [Desulfuromonas sp. DDH964]AMV70628.1 Cytochrome c-type biogenesis protein CcmH precursor [Desulfuromonas sp. DDH964]